MPDKIFVRNISDELWRSVKAKAALEGITLSEAVEEALRYYLNHPQADGNVTQDAWMTLTNLGSSGISDVSEQHDKYIAEAASSDVKS